MKITLNADEVVRLRKVQGLSQEKLARATGLSHGLIGHLELGSRQPSEHSLALIAGVLGVRPQDIATIAEAA